MVSSEFTPASCYLKQNVMTKKLWCMHEVPENYVLSALISALVSLILNTVHLACESRYLFQLLFHLVGESLKSMLWEINWWNMIYFTRKTIILYSNGYDQAHYTKCMSISPEFKNISYEHPMHAQQWSYLIQAQSFSSTPKSRKRKKVSPSGDG